MTVRIIPVLLALTALTTIAHADPIVADVADADAAKGAETHDGFFLRMATGPAAFGASIDVDGGRNLELGGSGTQFELSIGGALSENVILHADLLTVGSTNLGGDEGGIKGDFDNKGLGLGGLGLGVTWFINPHNIYVSGSIYTARLELARDVDNRDIESEARTHAAGMGRLTVGKEWWVSANWGLGIAASVYGGVGIGEIEGENGGPDRDFDTGFGGGSLMFSATFN